MGLRKDLNLTGDRYQWISSMFYFGTFNIRESSENRWLIDTRLPRLGISYQSTAPAATPCQILVVLHHHVGSGPLLHGCHQELLWCSCCTILPGRFRSRCDPRVRPFHLTGKRPPNLLPTYLADY